MAQIRCDHCGKKFNSEYNLQLHQEMDVCSEAEESPSADQSTDQEPVSKREHLLSDATGTVCMYEDDRGFGFVTTADITRKARQTAESTVDVFLHISEAETDWIEEGDRLRFDVYETEDGLKAEAAEVIERDQNRDSYDRPEDDASNRLGFGHNKDNTMRGPGKPSPTDRDIEGFQDDRKFR